MLIAARTTQMPVLAGAGEWSLTSCKFPSAGVRFRQPPLPELRLGERRVSFFGGSGTVVAMLLTSSCSNRIRRSLLVVRSLDSFRRILHYIIATRALDAVLIGIVINHRQFAGKVVVRRGGSRGPFQGSGFPRIIRRGSALEPAMDQVIQENELGKAGEQGSDGDEPVDRDERLEVIVDEGLVAAHVAGDPQIMKRHKDAICPHKREPEV